MTEEQFQQFLDELKTGNLKRIADYLEQGYIPSSNGETPTDPTADYPDPIVAARIGYRRLEFKKDYKTHILTYSVNGKLKTKTNGAGNLEYVVKQEGIKFPAGEAVNVWFYGVGTNILQRGWEICDKPGFIVLRRSTHVRWDILDGIDYWLPKTS